jgi:uncharacterized phage-like protein YoqJ
MHTIAFTGHRPKDIPGIGFIEFAAALDALVKGRTDLHFVVGGALGTDSWAATYALTRNIPYTLVTPFDLDVMTRFWTDAAKKSLRTQRNAAEAHIVINPGAYDVRAYQTRNEAMVDQADVVFAVYNGKRGGGTYNCIRYALKAGKPVYNLFPLNGRMRQIAALA